MKRKFFFAFLIFLAFSAALITYLNRVYLPAKIRSIITVSLARQINAQITFKDLDYNFFKGIVIKDLAVSTSPESGSVPVFSAKEVSFQVLYLPIFRSKSIIIPSLKVDGALINIMRFPDGKWNFHALNLKPQTKPEFLFLVYRVNLASAKIFFEDYGVAEPFLTEIPQLKAKAHFALPKNVKFSLEAKLAKETTSAVLLINGSYDLGSEALAAKINLHNLNPLVFLSYFEMPFALNAATIKEAQAEMFLDRSGLRLKSHLACEDIDITKDLLHLNINALINLQLNNQTFYAEAEVFNATLKGISRLKEISAVKGKLFINPQEINFKELQGISQGVVLAAAGRIYNPDSPQLEAKVFASPRVEKLVEIFSDLVSRYEFEAKGETQLVLNLSGALSQPVVMTDLQLTNTMLDTPQLKLPLTEINGKVQITQDSATWEKLSFVCAENTFVTTGTLEDFANPALELTLGSKALSLSAKLDIFKDSLNFSRLDGKYLNSAFALTGKVDLNEPDNPWLDLAGKLTLNLKDLKELEPFEPTGMLNIQGTLRGFLKNRRLWQLDLNANCPQITLRGLKLNALSLRLNQPEKDIDEIILHAEAYHGTLEVFSKLFLKEEELPVDLSANIRDLDLALLKLDTAFKDKPTAGKLTSLLHLRFPAKDWRQMNGAGAFSITNGNLWEINLLKGLGAFLFIPEFQKIVLEEAAADFTVADQEITTSNLAAKSKDLDLSAEGKLNFSGRIKFLVTATLNPDLIASSASLKKFITSAITSSNGALAIRINGDLKNPKYTIIPATMDVLRRVREFFFEDILR